MRLLTAALLTAAVVVAVPASPAAVAEAPAAGSTYTALSPTRVLDTRTGGQPIGPASSTSVDLSGRVPASATAVVFNLTGTEPTANTFLTVSPHGQARPAVSNLNLRVGETRANLVTVVVGAARVLDLYNNAGRTHAIADLAGYYSTGAGSRFLPVQPSRALSEHVGPGSTTTVDLSWAIPPSATAVVLNVTAANSTGDTFVTAWPAGTTRPNASTVNVPVGATNPNLTTVAVGAGRLVSIYNNAGQLDLVVDIQGFYTPDFGALFTPLSPKRIFDTRDGTGASSATPISQGWHRSVSPGAAVPAEAIGAVVNITGIDPTADTYVTAWQYTNLHGPFTSNLNLVRGQTAANLAVVEINDDVGAARFYAYNNAGDTHVAMDLAGYFSMPNAPCTHDCAYVWGSNGGYLGVGTRTYNSMPTPLYGLSGVVSVASRTAALDDGSLWSWGFNGAHNMGDDWGLTAYVPFPVRVPGFTGAIAVADTDGAGFSPTQFALKADGTVWSWGTDAYGTLGTGGVWSNSGRPQRVSGLTGVTAIAGGTASGYALRNDGTVWAWGWNKDGQLGTGSTAAESNVPVRVSGLANVVDISAMGNNAVAITADGSLWVWGSNAKGTLGNGTTGGISRVPVRVSGLNDVVAADADGENGYAVQSDGTVWSWGSGDWAGLGDGSNCVDCVRNVPGRVDGITGAVDVVSHYSGAQVLDSTGHVWLWGWNQSGDVGIPPSSAPVLRPMQNPYLTGVTVLGDGGQALAP
ncbi:RCC1 domain-containing protein [Actinophytocola oryzae]|uniref:Alpha-tubulin suppressor-like RCC1 family protein n=1 Tax=Actinophytocola oryzae TaxID=502181 RepID=A0A4R7UTR5_9PSEU|nr:hypothetical protein [Actinophytocola oryzae]TDV37781.1 alpha-tubulin suppressor-like RCC1 family protein [Actinophytocola oryzae]